MPLPPAPHGTLNRWRTKCRCIPCGTVHTGDTTARRRCAADAKMPADVRARLLRLIRHGIHLNDAAARVGVSLGQIWGRARRDPAWRRRLDEALMQGRDPDVPHGTPSGYRHHRCRCPECRAAHHPECHTSAAGAVAGAA